MIVTVAGFLPFESGKTRLTARLARALRERGVRLAVVKPIGAHSLWEQHFSVEYSVEHRVLVGGDAIRLARAIDAKPEDVEPVDILLTPPDIERFLARPRDYLNIVSNTFQQAVLLRINACAQDRKRYHILVEDAYSTTPPSLRSVLDELIERLEPKPIRVNRDAFNEMLVSGQLVTSADICTAAVSAAAELTLIESFNDVLIPVPKAAESRLFLVTAPGRVAIYRGEDVVKAASVLTGIKPGFIRTHEVLGLVKPVSVESTDFAYSDDQLGEDVEKLADMLLKLEATQ